MIYRVCTVNAAIGLNFVSRIEFPRHFRVLLLPKKETLRSAAQNFIIH